MLQKGFNLKLDTSNFECERNENEASSICHSKTDANGRFSFSNVVFGKYHLSAQLVQSGLKFSMSPELIVADLTKHADLSLSQKFILSKVSLTSRAWLSENVRPLI